MGEWKGVVDEKQEEEGRQTCRRQEKGQRRTKRESNRASDEKEKAEGKRKQATPS